MTDYKILNRSIGLVETTDGGYVVLNGASANLNELFEVDVNLEYVPLNPDTRVLSVLHDNQHHV